MSCTESNAVPEQSDSTLLGHFGGGTPRPLEKRWGGMIIAGITGNEVETTYVHVLRLSCSCFYRRGHLQLIIPVSVNLYHIITQITDNFSDTFPLFLKVVLL